MRSTRGVLRWRVVACVLAALVACGCGSVRVTSRPTGARVYYNASGTPTVSGWWIDTKKTTPYSKMWGDPIFPLGIKVKWADGTMSEIQSARGGELHFVKPGYDQATARETAPAPADQGATIGDVVGE